MLARVDFVFGKSKLLERKKKTRGKRRKISKIVSFLYIGSLLLIAHEALCVAGRDWLSQNRKNISEEQIPRAKQLRTMGKKCNSQVARAGVGCGKQALEGIN